MTDGIHCKDDGNYRQRTQLDGVTVKVKQADNMQEI